MAIFIQSCPDVDVNMLSFCDDIDSFLNLSCVNKAAYVALNNNKFFKELFERHHPYLTKSVYEFKNLFDCHPSNCWKVLCCVFSSNYVFKPNDSFIKDSIPFICTSLNSLNAQLEIEQKEICGSYYADPNSPIDQAWKAYEKCKQKREMLENDCREIRQQSSTPSKHSCLGKGIYISNGYKTIVPWGDDEPQEDDQSQEDLRIKEKELELNRTRTKEFELHCTYTSLNNNLLSCKLALKEVYEKLIIFDLSSNAPESLYGIINVQKNNLETEINVARLLELNETINLILCIIKSNEIVNTDGESDDTDVAKTEINEFKINFLCSYSKDSINSLPSRLSSHIWAKLYETCANGAQEDQWSEKHFHEFLGPLNKIIVKLGKSEASHQHCFYLDSRNEQRQAKMRSKKLFFEF